MAALARVVSRARTPSRRGWCRWGLAAFAVAAVVVRPATAADPAQIQKAIDRGTAYLFDHQTNGNWELVQARDPTVTAGASQVNTQWGGPTAVATLALLATGVPASDPHVQRAVAFLRKADIRGNYALGMRAQVWQALPPEPWLRQAELDDAGRLLKGLITGKAGGPADGLYSYAAGRPVGEADHSVSQIAVLGMWALAQAEVEVPSGYWTVVDAAWHRQETAAGSWGYETTFDPAKAALVPATHQPNSSMTAAGVATLLITQEYLRLAPRCGGNVDDPAIDAGLKYLGDHATELTYGREYYNLYGLSRVGLASGRKRLGATDWFQFGADYICRTQAASGAWTSDSLGWQLAPIPNTALSLLFLARGRAPVMLNKLSYDVTAGTGRSARVTPGTWNQRPRDAANLSRWVGRQIESPLNWQLVTLGQSSSEDLHDAPILYMAGGKAPKLSAADTDRLRAYVEEGGLVLGHADCAAPDFDKGFVALGAAMFPGYKFRHLEASSPILTNEQFPAAQSTSSRPAVEVLSNGTRELMVLLPTGDPARTWQSQTFQQAKKETFGQLMVNLFLYAVDKEGLRRRGETYLVDRDASKPAGGKPIKVARLKYGGNWDPEPGGWRRLSNVMHNDGTAEVTTEPVDGPIDPSYRLASLTVCAADARLTDAERSGIRDYVNGGGTLLVDVAGGRGLYRTAAEAEIARIFPDAPRELPVLLPGSPVYAAGKVPLTSVDFRRFQRPGPGHVPLLRGRTVGGRVAVLYSPEDLSTGLVGQPIDGVAGYDPASALAVVEHVLLYVAR